MKEEVHQCKNAFLKEVEGDEDYVHNLFNYKGQYDSKMLNFTWITEYEIAQLQ